jgi:putative oxidoreductase
MTKAAFEGVAACCEFHTISLGCALQRLFSTFPNGWPGLGLLLLRLCVGIALVSLGVSSFGASLIAAAGGIFLIAGLWTPVTGALIALDELWIAFSVYSLQRDGQWIHIFLAALTTGVAMLGPGAWSVDARLFGRRRFDIGDRAHGRKQ